MNVSIGGFRTLSLSRFPIDVALGMIHLPAPATTQHTPTRKQYENAIYCKKKGQQRRLPNYTESKIETNFASITVTSD